MKPKLATKEEMQVLKDLAEKATADVGRAVDMTIDLAVDEVGPMGMFLICQRLAQFMVRGCSVAINKASKNEVSEDDAELFAIVLLAAAAEQHENSFFRAKELFKLITNREAPHLPGVVEE